MKKRLLVIDGQIFQTDAKDRGMGRYSARFIQSLLDQKYYSKTQLIIRKSPGADSVSRDLRRMFPGIEIVRLNLVNTNKYKVETAANHNKKEVNNFIAKVINKKYFVDYLIPSPFQEPVVSVFPNDVKKILVFYDLIPYLYHYRYKPLMQFDNYLKRFSLLFEADKILTISQSVRDDLIMYLGIPRDRINAIDGAAIESGECPQKPKGIEIPDRYILMPTSDDPRKNNLRAVLGFEEFRLSAQSNDYKLVITSKIHKSERSRLVTFSNNIVFTGNVSEAELDWLYNNCQAVLFVPESEGLGLPVLEAVSAGKRVICSSINVFKEISEDSFYYCEHDNQNSIAFAITKALSADDLSVPKTKYRSILKHYSWDQTAKRSIQSINNTEKRKNCNYMKIAVFTPRVDGLSAIGKVVAEAHPTFSEYFDVDYYVESGQYLESTRPNYLQYAVNCFPASSFSVEKYMNYDAVIYHIGNSDYHIESIRNSLYLPGYVILHDTNIHEAYRIMYENGMISFDRKNLEEKISKKSNSRMSRCISSVANNQLGVIVHSDYAKKAIREVLVSDVPIKLANLSTNCPSMTKRRDYDKLTIGLAGIIADIKGISVIETLASNSAFNNCEIKLFGYNFTSQETIDRISSHINVSVSTNLSDFDFQNNVSKLDIFVNYRMKYQGETSLATIEAMRQGVVVIVRNIGWYSELPDDVVVKVESEDEVNEKIFELMSNKTKLAKISSNAKQYVEKNHNHEQYCMGILELINTSKVKDTNIQNKVAKKIKQGEIKTKQQLLNLYQKAANQKRGIK